MLAYTLVTRTPITFGKAVPVPFIPEDNARALAWNASEQGALVDGWVEGKGSRCGYRTQKLRVGEGLDGECCRDLMCAASETEPFFIL